MSKSAFTTLLVAAIGCSGGDEQGVPDAGPRLREKLSQTGLYADLSRKEVAGDLIYFEPAHVLWSDGAGKRRWMRLPPGTKIDTSDMDHWQFPVGTQFFKEFSKDGKLLETRLVERIAATGDAAADYWMGAFVWLDDESDALFAVDGATDVRGTPHDVPAQLKCGTCHNGEAGRALGMSRVQLSKPPPALNAEELARRGLLSDPPGAYQVPGSPVTAAALGYLHANCGHCHNNHGSSWPDTQQVLRLSASETVAEETAIYRTTVNQRTHSFQRPGFEYIIVSGHPEDSALFFRMTQRAPRDGMPPIAAELPDDTGIELVRQWILSMAAD